MIVSARTTVISLSGKSIKRLEKKCEKNWLNKPVLKRIPLNDSLSKVRFFINHGIKDPNPPPMNVNDKTDIKTLCQYFLKFLFEISVALTAIITFKNP